MSRIADLLAEFCPRGVPYRALGEIGALVRGHGMPKSDFAESGVGCIGLLPEAESVGVLGGESVG